MMSKKTTKILTKAGRKHIKDSIKQAELFAQIYEKQNNSTLSSRYRFSAKILELLLKEDDKGCPTIK